MSSMLPQTGTASGSTHRVLHRTLPNLTSTHGDATWYRPSRMVAVGVSTNSASRRERRDRTGNNQHNAEVPTVADQAPYAISSTTGRPAQIGTDLQKRNPGCYFRSCLAMTMRWIWLVPS